MVTIIALTSTGPMSGTLFVVATPIGNLEDITCGRCASCAKRPSSPPKTPGARPSCSSHYGISTPTISFHEHNTRTRLPQLHRRLEGGENRGSGDGCGNARAFPIPGVELVRGMHRGAGLPVDPIPGASAPLTAAVASGFPLIPLTIFGFPPTSVKRPERLVFANSGDIQHTVTFFESPHRIAATLSERSLMYWVNRPIMRGA